MSELSEGTRVTFLVQMDPKSTSPLPDWLLERLATDCGRCITNIHNYFTLKRKNHTTQAVAASTHRSRASSLGSASKAFLANRSPLLPRANNKHLRPAAIPTRRRAESVEDVLISPELASMLEHMDEEAAAATGGGSMINHSSLSSSPERGVTRLARRHSRMFRRLFPSGSDEGIKEPGGGGGEGVGLQEVGVENGLDSSDESTGASTSESETEGLSPRRKIKSSGPLETSPAEGIPTEQSVSPLRSPTSARPSTKATGTGTSSSSSSSSSSGLHSSQQHPYRSMSFDNSRNKKKKKKRPAQSAIKKLTQDADKHVVRGGGASKTSSTSTSGHTTEEEEASGTDSSAEALVGPGSNGGGSPEDAKKQSTERSEEKKKKKTKESKKQSSSSTGGFNSQPMETIKGE